MASDLKDLVSKELRERLMTPRFNHQIYARGGIKSNSPVDNVDNAKILKIPEEGPEPTSSSDTASSSSYKLACDRSLYSQQVDSWIRNPSPNTESAAIQMSRVPVTQRSTLAPSASLDPNGMWYLMAMVLPLFSAHNAIQWRCTPSTVINAAEMFVAHIVRCCRRARANIRRMADDQLTRDLLASLMDIVLIVYAIGFLVISLYQAAVFD